MKRYIPVDIRTGMAAPIVYLRIFGLVCMWWGRRNGGLEMRWDGWDAGTTLWSTGKALTEGGGSR